MKQKGFSPIFVIFIVLVLVGGWYYFGSSNKNRSQTPIATPISNGQATTNPWQSAIKESSNTVVNKPRWVHLSSSLVGVEFDYPVPTAGTVIFELRDYGNNNFDPSGQIYNWSLRNDSTVSIAGGVSASFKIGRSPEETDFYQLNSGNYNNAIKTFQTKYGGDAVLKKTPLPQFGNYTPSPNDNRMTLYVNLPIKRDPRFHGLAIYFINGISEPDAERVVNSITINE